MELQLWQAVWAHSLQEDNNVSKVEQELSATVVQGAKELWESLANQSEAVLRKRGYTNDTIKSVQQYKAGVPAEDIIRTRMSKPSMKSEPLKHPEFKRTAKDVQEPNAPLRATASSAPAEPPKAGSPEATSAILNIPTETGLVKAGSEFEQPASPSMLPKLYETVDTYRGVGKPNGRQADVASDLPPGAASIPPKEGDVIEAQWSSKGEQGLVPLTPKELARAKTYANTAGISEDAAKEKLFGKRAAIMGGLGAVGTAAALVRKDTADKEPSAVMETPSPLSDKGKASYDATIKGQAAKPDYSAASLMQPPTLSASKVGRNAPEAPDMSPEDNALAEQLGRMQNEMKIVAAEYKATKDQQAKQQLWEGLISGLGAIASGMYGLKHGLDMSGVKFDRTNWDAKATAAREDWIAGRMAAEKDYELSKSIIDQKRKGKLDNWEINQKLYENAAREAQRRDDMSYKSAGLGLEAQKLGAQMENWKEEATNRKAELMLKIKQGSGDKTMQNLILGKIDDFDKTLATYGKNEDDLSLQTLKRLNGEINKLTGAPLVPESSFEGGWIGGPEAADIEKARTPAVTADANMPLPSGGKVRMMDKQGRKMEVPEENVEKAKAAGWQILQN